MANKECEFFSISLKCPRENSSLKWIPILSVIDRRDMELLTKESVNPTLEEELGEME